jgi:flagellin-like hook-associated protein FlgL
MAGITLSAGVRQNLLSLQNTADMMATTQNRLATGKKVNSALDNPSSFFTSSSLQSRASDMSALLDSMSNGVKTLEAADNGLKSITKTLESMQSTLRQARQDKSFATKSYTLDSTALTAATIDTNAEAGKVSFTGGAVGTTAVGVDLTTAKGVLTAATNYANLDFAEAGDKLDFKLALDGSATTTQVTVENGTAANSLKITVGSTVTDNIAVAAEATVTGAEMVAGLNTAFTAANLGVTVAGSTGAKLTFTANTAADGSKAAVSMSNLVVSNGGAGTALADTNFGFVAGGAGVTAGGAATITGVTAKTVDQLVTAINANAGLAGKVRAANDDGKLRFENQSTQDLTVTGFNSTSAKLDGTAGTSTIGGNKVRAGLSDQFNELKDQLDKLSDDASYNGINLLRGDKLKITFNETGTSTIDIQTDAGKTINSAYLSVAEINPVDLDSDDGIDTMLDTVKDALNTVSSQSSTFGSNLSIVQNRQDFTSNMITTLQTGADSLILADTNAEAANMLALQTRQQLASTALSMASQSDQAALRLF